MDQLTVIDFFCGAGGFSEGFRQQGFKIIQGYDNWQPAIDTFNHNFKTESTVKNILEFENSIEAINSLPNTEVIIGSPPCVSFSSSNISGKADKKSGVLLTKIFLRIVAVKKFQKDSILKAWFMENVANSRNYLSHYYTFKDLGLSQWAKDNRYSPDKKAIILENNQPIINSADYGSCQTRRRAISGEIIKEGKLVVPNPTFSGTEDSNLPKWRNLNSIKAGLPSPASKYQDKPIQDLAYPEIIIRFNQLTDHFYDSGLYESEWKQSRYLKVNHPFMGRMSFPEDENKPSRTIIATKSGQARESLIYKSEYKRKGNGEYRIPTIREAASIMGFPITYQFLGSMNSKWRLVGNAVCPSVSRAFAGLLREQLGLDKLDRLILERLPDTHGINNLNTFSEKLFDNQPVRTKNSRFRRHPIKDGNMTVSLSNYNIEKNSKVEGKWLTSIQYGTGEGFPIQNVPDDYYIEIESAIEQIKSGKRFIEIINNGFSEMIAPVADLQKMYELQRSENEYLEPTELVEKVAELISDLKVKNEFFVQKEKQIFQNKKKVPASQLLALYAINKITSLANKK
jgi:DNA (cytosine-5)-methyltransferase 1